MDVCFYCVHYKACMHLIDTSKEELTVCEHFESKGNIEELKSKNSNLTSDLTSSRAEIERLEERLKREAKCQYDLCGQIVDLKYMLPIARAEAVKEFAARLKDAPIKMGLPLLGLQTKSEVEEYFDGIMLQVRDSIDNLVKELTEENV